VAREASTVRHGGFACRVRNRHGLATRALRQAVLNSSRRTEFEDVPVIDGAEVTASAWVHASRPDGVRIALADADGRTVSAGNSAAGTWERIVVTRRATLRPGGVSLQVVFAPGAEAAVDGVTATLGRLPLDDPGPEALNADELAATEGSAFTEVDRLIWQEFQRAAAEQGSRFGFLAVMPMDRAQLRELAALGIPHMTFWMPFSPAAVRAADMAAGRYEPALDSHRFGYKANEVAADQMLQFLDDRGMLPR
jgi:hypothetical protein